MKRAYSWQALMRSPWFASAAAKRRCAARSKGAISTATPRSTIALTRSFLRAKAAAPSRSATSAPSRSSREISVRASPPYESTSPCLLTSSRYAVSAWRSRPLAKSFAAASLARRWSFATFVSTGRPCCASARANSVAFLLSMTLAAARRARPERGRMWGRSEVGVVSRPCVGGERYGEDVAPGLVHETRHDAALFVRARTEGERRVAARTARQRVERGLERGQRVDHELVRRDRPETLVCRELLRGVGVDGRDRLVDEGLGLIAVTLGLRDREADPVVIDEERVRADADRACVTLDDVPDRREVHACSHDGHDDAVRGDGRREEERGLVRDDGVRRVAHVRRALHRGEEVLPEGDARAFIRRYRRRDDGAFRVDDGDGFVLGRAGGGGRKRGARGPARLLVAEVCRVSDDVRELGDKDDVAQAAGEVCVDRVRCRGGALGDVRHAERGEVGTCVVRRNDADERDRGHPDDEEGREYLLPESDTRPTHTLPCPARPIRPPSRASTRMVGALSHRA